MPELEAEVINPLGLHARAAAKVVRAVAAFDADVAIVRVADGGRANAKDILSILSLAVNVGSRVIITADGPEAESALAAVNELFTAGFGEIDKGS